jgi:hypothetical protein
MPMAGVIKIAITYSLKRCRVIWLQELKAILPLIIIQEQNALDVFGETIIPEIFLLAVIFAKIFFK